MKRSRLRQLARKVRAHVFSLIDFLVPKARQVWVFPVYFLGKGAFCDNALAVLQSISADVPVKCFILARDTEIVVEDERCTVLPMSSYRATWVLMRSSVVFTQHSIWLDYAKAKFRMRNLKDRVVVNLWHGIPIKDLSHSNTGIHNREGLKEMPHYLIPCSSELDRVSMRAAFHATPEKNLWITGIPRNDFLVCEEDRLPVTYKEQLTEIRSKLLGRKLVLYVPTYRETTVGGEYKEFTPEQLEELEQLLRRHSAVLGVRFHSYRPPGNQEGLMALSEVIDLSGGVVDDVRLLVRESSAVITDYSSIGLDALYARVPLISFAYDLDHYKEQQRGFFYDLTEIFGSDIARNFSELKHKLNKVLEVEEYTELTKSASQRQFESRIFAYRDDRNGERLSNQLLNHVQARFGHFGS